MTKPATTIPPRRRRLAPMPLMLMAMAALIVALWAGLLRLGWKLPLLDPQTLSNHGPLMVNGFLGTVISMERAVALGRNLGGRHRYMLVPLLAALGGLAMLLRLEPVIYQALSVGSALGLVLIFVVIYRMQPGADHAVMLLAAVMWLVGNLFWLAGSPVPQVVPWWAGFLVLTIAGERLELAAVLLMSKGARATFIAVVGLFTVGLTVMGLATIWTTIPLLTPALGLRIAGLGLIAMGLWLLRFDIARLTIRRTGLTRYIAACLLPGYVWLIIGGALWLIHGMTFAGPIYDALLHTIFLGFVISMIFGHAPVIIPAVMGVKIPYRPVFYVHLVLLHLSLILRVAGDLRFNQTARLWGGMLNEVAVVLFLVVTVIAARQGAREAKAAVVPKG